MVQKLASIWRQLHAQEKEEGGRGKLPGGRGERTVKGRDTTAANLRRKEKTEENVRACVACLRESEAYEKMLLCENLPLNEVSQVALTVCVLS
eukprot:584872-Hanusia_phi.AAC.1